MKKTFLTVLAMLLLSSSAMAFPFFNFKKAQSTELVTVPYFAAESTAQNRVWVGTFELVWNVLIDEVVKGPVNFVGTTPNLVKELNKQAFKADMLSSSAYYTAHGKMTTDLKSTIEKSLKEKFNESSDLLKGMDWNSDQYLIYAMLKKDFEFITAFDKLPKEKFGANKTKVNYFGINEESKSDLRDNLSVMFYNSSKDFAVKIYTKDHDKIILYRNNDNKPFDQMYEDVLTKMTKYEGSRNFTKKDELKVPFIKFKTKHEYSELENNQIAGTDFTIKSALQTIDFDMDNTGVKLKSEAALIMKMSLLQPETGRPRKFYFNDTFTIFLIEQDEPYFALRVKDVEAINSNK